MYKARFCTIAFLLLSLSLFAFTEQQVTFISLYNNLNLSLNGTMTIPDGVGPFPVAILVHGSGPVDQDGSITIDANIACFNPGSEIGDQYKILKDIAHTFADSGIAVLRYDKLTFAHPDSLDPFNLTISDFINDIHSAVDFVKTFPGMDTSNIMLVGHSQGCNLISAVALEREDIKTLINIGAASQSIVELIAQQNAYFVGICQNMPGSASAAYSKTISDFAPVLNGSWPDNMLFSGASEEFWQDWNHITSSAIDTYNALDLPTLFLQGTEDFQVPLAEGQHYMDSLSRSCASVFFMNGYNHFMIDTNSHKVANEVFESIFTWMDTICKKEDTVSSVVPTRFQDEFSIFASGGQIITKAEESQLPYSLSVYNMMGQRVYQENTVYKSAHMIALPDVLRNRFYFVHVHSDEIRLTKKVYVHR